MQLPLLTHEAHKERLKKNYKQESCHRVRFNASSIWPVGKLKVAVNVNGQLKVGAAASSLLLPAAFAFCLCFCYRLGHNCRLLQGSLPKFQSTLVANKKKKLAKDNFESPKKIKGIGGRKEKGSSN